MPLTMLEGWNLPENGTAMVRPATMSHYGTESADSPYAIIRHQKETGSIRQAG